MRRRQVLRIDFFTVLGDMRLQDLTLLPLIGFFFGFSLQLAAAN